jgi:hypothetical protein
MPIGPLDVGATGAATRALNLKENFVLRSIDLTRLVAVAATSLMLLAGATVASATSTTGNQNPDLTVSASLASDGADPDVATNGNVVTATATETNNTVTKQSVRVVYTLTYPDPDGRVVTSAKQFTLAPGQTQTQSLAYTVDAADPRGTYTYTVSASDKRGTSSATATILVD